MYNIEVKGKATNVDDANVNLFPYLGQKIMKRESLPWFAFSMYMKKTIQKKNPQKRKSMPGFKIAKDQVFS